MNFIRPWISVRPFSSSLIRRKPVPNGEFQQIFKESMSRVSSQAMILTNGFKGEADPAKFHGMTISSVSSLSAFPKPLLQFNLHLPSFTSDQLHAYKVFAIHLLPPVAKSVEIARCFSLGVKSSNNTNGRTTPFTTLDRTDWDVAYHEKETESHGWLEEGVNIPVLNVAERVFICEKKEVFHVDNHEIWVAEVKDIKCHDQHDRTGGLIFFNRGFHVLGEKLVEP